MYADPMPMMPATDLFSTDDLLSNSPEKVISEYFYDLAMVIENTMDNDSYQYERVILHLILARHLAISGVS